MGFTKDHSVDISSLLIFLRQWPFRFYRRKNIFGIWTRGNNSLARDESVDEKNTEEWVEVDRDEHGIESNEEIVSKVNDKVKERERMETKARKRQTIYQRWHNQKPSFRLIVYWIIWNISQILCCVTSQCYNDCIHKWN